MILVEAVVAGDPIEADYFKINEKGLVFAKLPDNGDQDLTNHANEQLKMLTRSTRKYVSNLFVQPIRAKSRIKLSHNEWLLIGHVAELRKHLRMFDKGEDW